ncbi:MinD/ParA family protein [Eubacteriales bacterium OttesenSCG-928-M02]|nr:MinD/ParA family protein [Eubacteriales bacterium OttesenSCG-928-M02]
MDQAHGLRQMMRTREGAQASPGIQVITITSAKGGVGKSSVALNMAIALSRMGKRTLLVDMDLGLANIDVMLGVRTQYDLSNAVRGEKDIREIIETGLGGVRFISGGSGMEELLNMDEAQLEGILTRLFALDDMVDIILFDTGAGITDLIMQLICASNTTWLVTTPEPTAIMDAYALMKTLNREETQPEIQLIVNQAGSETEARAALDGFIRITEKYTDVNITELGYIMNDPNMVRAIKQQEPLLVSYPNSVAAGNIEGLGNKFLQRAAPQSATGLAGFFARLFGKKMGGLV